MSEGERYKLRELQADDYSRGFLQLLGQLTTVGSVSLEDFQSILFYINQIERFDYLKSRSQEYFIIVIQDLSQGTIVGSGTIFLERKFIHDCGIVGHIEDIVTDESVRGKGLGKLIIQELIEIAKKNGAYKVLLSSLEKNVPFYEKCGLVPKSVSMALYLDK